LVKNYVVNYIRHEDYPQHNFDFQSFLNGMKLLLEILFLSRNECNMENKGIKNHHTHD